MGGWEDLYLIYLFSIVSRRHSSIQLDSSRTLQCPTLTIAIGLGGLGLEVLDLLLQLLLRDPRSYYLSASGLCER